MDICCRLFREVGFDAASQWAQYLEGKRWQSFSTVACVLAGGFGVECNNDLQMVLMVLMRRSLEQSS